MPWQGETRCPQLRWWVLGVLLFSSLLLIFTGLGARDLWDSGETRYALKALTMRQTGNWIVPVLKGKVWLNKPPLLMWLINLFGSLGGGINEWTARLPSAFAGLGTVLLVFWWGQRLEGPLFGGIAGLSLLTSSLFVIRARFNDPEPLLAFLITLALFAFYAHYHGWARGRLWWMMYAAMGLATLTKGPIGLVLLWMVILTYLMSRNDLGALRRMHLGKGLLLFAAIILPWFLSVALVFGESVQMVLYGEILRTALGTGGRLDPWYFYIGGFPLAFFPWSLFLLGLPVVWRHHRARDGNPSEGLYFATIWFSLIFLTLSLMSKKRVYYALHLLPPAALLIAYSWQYLLAGGFNRHPRLRQMVQYLFAGFALVGLLLSVVAGGGLRVQRFSLSNASSLTNFLVPAAVVIGLFLAVYLIRARRDSVALIAFSAAVFCSQLLAVHSLIPTWYSSNAKFVAETLRQHVKPGAEIYHLVFYSHAIAFYFGREIPLLPHNMDDVDHLLERGKPFYLLTDKQMGQEVLNRHRHRMMRCTEFRYAKRKVDLLLLANRDCTHPGSRGGFREIAKGMLILEAPPL
ncbi:MAG: ArnT family glycosyltransferase [Candidatus Methylomirabilales bacterium]